MKTIEIVGENYCGNWDKTRTVCRGIVIDGERILFSYEAKTNQWMIPGGGERWLMNITYEKAKEEDIEPIYELCKQLIHDYEQLETIDYPKVMNWIRKRQKIRLMNIQLFMPMVKKQDIIIFIKMKTDNLKQMICLCFLSSKITELVRKQ